VAPYLGSETFCFTYGDGLSDVNITATIEHHRKSKRLATVTAVQPPGRFGMLDLSGDTVAGFIEKPEGDGGWINGGFFVLEPGVVDYIANDSTMWERDPMQRLATENQLSAYVHRGFWQPMDTLRDKLLLEDLWSKGDAPWKLE
jgi:glucose-1-phosphate cytidylyltransferase